MARKIFLDSFICANSDVSLYDKNLKIIKEPDVLEWNKPYEVLYKDFYKKYLARKIIRSELVDEIFICGAKVIGIIIDYEEESKNE